MICRLRSLSLLFALAACAPAADSPPVSEPEPPALEARGTIAAADGVEIVYESAGDGETTLVFVHCWACDREFWRGQLEALAADYRVAALDLPGHGESGSGRASWSILGLSDDVRALVEAYDLDRVVLIGHSMGGPVALGAAPLLGDRLIGIVLVDTVHDADQGWTAEMAEPVIAAFEADFEGTNARFVPALFPPEADPLLVQWVLDKANASDHEAAKALMRDFPNLDQAALMAAAGVPIRAVNAAPLGEMIPATAIEGNRRYADYDAVIVDGVGHYLMLERPKEFNRYLAAAIGEIEAGGARR